MHAIILIFGLLFVLLAAAVLALLAGLLPILLIVVLFGVGVGLCVFWIWMLVDAIQNRGLSEGEKVGWVLAIVFLHLLAAVLYFFIGRPRRHRPLISDTGGFQRATR